ncbi:hypothetical protein RJT34_07071 [Clitoria ternatea]|uniref:Uncharacterized protein n=1 Tax=Clitoria ternatea TaxID=43366 RepID=A0AAN9K4Q7_CLITE
MLEEKRSVRVVSGGEDQTELGRRQGAPVVPLLLLMVILLNPPWKLLNARVTSLVQKIRKRAKGEERSECDDDHEQ